MRVLILALLPLATAVAQPSAPRHVYLTWAGDTGTTMTVVYHTFGREPGPSVVRYGPDGAGGYPLEARGASHQIPDLDEDRHVHVVELTGLRPGGRYAFVAGRPGEESAPRAFRTVPADGRPVRFVTGGDLGVSDEVLRLHRHAASYEPQFALVGGDVAYVDGDLDAVARWDAWFDQWAHMVTPSGLTVPLVVAVGNHEVQGGYLGGVEAAPFFFGFFPQTPRDAPRSYFRRAFGANVAVYVLDTGHVVEHGGAQAAWLDEQLAADADVPHRFALYHVPLYPSHRAYDGGGSVRGRAAWGDLFDRHGLTAAFENHDHTFKRTRPLRGDSVDAAGVLYLGDGAWGRGDRPVDLSRRWYHAKAGSLRHVWVVDAGADGVTYRAFDLDGRLLDVYPGGGPEAAEADAHFASREQSYALRDGSITVAPLRTRAGETDEERLTVGVHNQEDYPAEGALSVEPADGLRVEPARQPLALRPGEHQTLAFTLRTDAPIAPEAFPRAVLDIDLSFARPDGEARYRSARPVAVEPALRAELGSASVDGDLSEWGPLPFSMGRPAEGHLVGDPGRDVLGTWGGPDDASLAFGVRTDDDGVVLGVRVRDDVVSVDVGEGPWNAALGGPRHDALVVWADPHPGGEGDDDPAFVVDLAGATDRGIAVVDGDFEEAAAGVRAASAPTADGYAVEVSLPWSFFEGRSDAPVEAVRLNLAIADRDDADESPRVLYWRPSWESGEDYPWSGLVDLHE
jgi:hypothetical protein